MRMLPIAIALAACGGAESTTAAIDTLASGAVRVVNHEPSLWVDTSGWKIVLQVEQNFLFDSVGYLDAPNYPHQLDNGEMVVVNQKPQFIQRYAADFSPIGTIGREGSGPGEFELPSMRSFGDSLVVIDGARSILQLYSGEGEFLGESNIPVFTDWMAPRNRTGLLPLLGRYAQNSGAGVIWWSIEEGRAVDTLIGPPAPERTMWESCRFIIPYQASLDLVPAAGGTAWIGTTDSDRFVLSNTGTDTLIVVENPSRPRFAVAESAVDELFDPEGFIYEQCGGEMKRSDLNSDRPAWSSLVLDGNENLWVSRPAAWGRSYDVYNPEGLYLGEVPSPFSGENTYWDGDRIMSVTRPDENGYKLRLYRIERSLVELNTEY